MKNKRVEFKYKNKNFSLDFIECGFLKRISGLTFTRKSKAKALLFDFKKSVSISIHSLFVFFDFIVIWLDDKEKVIDLKVVRPGNFSVCPRRKFNKILEIPLNKTYLKFSRSLVGSSSEDKRFK